MSLTLTNHDIITADIFTDAFIETENDDIIYPSEDGELMAGSDFQRKPLIYAIDSLDTHFAQNEQVYVTGDLLIYYEEGNSNKSVAPDVCIVFNVPKHSRLSYKIWEEGKGPDVVIEILSDATWKTDVEEKPKLYRDLGVKEYFLYDPQNKHIQPALQGKWLDDEGQYQSMHTTTLPNDILKLDSHLLGLELHVGQTGQFRYFNPQTKEYLYTHQEEKQARQSAEAKWQAEVQARQAVEADRLAEAQARQAAEEAQQVLEQKLREAEEKLKQAGL